ncbi:MAG: PhzF family phenazine biosynthesis protein [Alphaproteobacteria bacterium]|nr:PhzF family phenazine biosynthesis protein [Alphaproteobacteria bacterium]
MRIPLYQVDAFADRAFAGKPAAVCLLEEWPEDSLLQSIALENNLSETAFLVPEGLVWRLRWFTPRVEVDLCGHATLASAHVVFENIQQRAQKVEFETRSGRLTVYRNGPVLSMEFPANPPAPAPVPGGLAEVLGAAPEAVLTAQFIWVAVFGDEAVVRALDPDFRRLAALNGGITAATAPGDEVDFVSRCFAPGKGIDEDPVTGSAHCALAPYWADRLGKTALTARQVSERGGRLACTLQGDRVVISGRAAPYLSGTIELP